MGNSRQERRQRQLEILERRLSRRQSTHQSRFPLYVAGLMAALGVYLVWRVWISGDVDHGDAAFLWLMIIAENSEVVEEFSWWAWAYIMYFIFGYFVIVMSLESYVVGSWRDHSIIILERIVRNLRRSGLYVVYIFIVTPAVVVLGMKYSPELANNPLRIVLGFWFRSALLIGVYWFSILSYEQLELNRSWLGLLERRAAIRALWETRHDRWGFSQMMFFLIAGYFWVPLGSKAIIENSQFDGSRWLLPLSVFIAVLLSAILHAFAAWRKYREN